MQTDDYFTINKQNSHFYFFCKSLDKLTIISIAKFASFLWLVTGPWICPKLIFLLLTYRFTYDLYFTTLLNDYLDNMPIYGKN